MFKYILLFCPIYIFCQSVQLKTWADKNDFDDSINEEIDSGYLSDNTNTNAFDIINLKAKYLNKKITPISVNKEFRQNYYKNFFKDKSFKKIIRDKSKRGFRQHSSNGNFGTLVFYQANSNYRILSKKIFEVVDIKPFRNRKSFQDNSDDTTFVFTIYNNELGKIYYRYNVKFINNIEIKLLNLNN